MHAWLRALRRIESTVPCLPWRVIFPSSSSAWKALESCSSCVPCTQLDMIHGPKVCLWYKRLCLVHCLCSYPCPNCPRCPPPFGVAAFLPSFLNLHPAGLPLAFHCLPTFLPSSVTDPRSQQAIYGLVMRALQVRHAGGLIPKLPRPAYARVCGFLYNKVAATNARPTYTTIKIPSKRHDHASAHSRRNQHPAQACVTKTECCQECMGAPWRAIMATAYSSVLVPVLLSGSMLYGPVQSRALELANIGAHVWKHMRVPQTLGYNTITLAHLSSSIHFVSIYNQHRLLLYHGPLSRANVATPVGLPTQTNTCPELTIPS
jgi:hypothetical protein